MIEPDFDPAAILEALDRHGVDYVLVGGYAANLHGAADVPHFSNPFWPPTRVSAAGGVAAG